jgi:peptide chain release factor subunit 1
MLPQAVADKIIGTYQAEMISNSKEILAKVEPILKAFGKKEEDDTIDSLLTKAMKNENAVLGIENVLNALQEGRIMKLVLLKDYKQSGLSCIKCGYLTVQNIASCPYCKGETEKVNYIVDFAAQKAIEQGSFVEVVSDNKKFREAGSIGAFLRF